ncbi:MAG TPA: hypothetical protein PKO39_00240 [Bacilli bacterium]|nr:hypothetical protein [Bacilli bacterium]HPZ26682.1 hypothetical protein [Bacilli bacterium]HQC88912.1 hypothetical protein [Bacilli bacterium]
MNVIQSIKLRYFTYRLFYVSFLILNYLTAAVVMFAFKDPGRLARHLTVGYIIASLIFSFLLGIYEYQVLYPKYMNLSNIKRDFYWGSLLGNIINSVVLVLNFLIFYVFINSLVANEITFVFPYKTSVYFFFGEALCLAFVGANVFTVMLRKLVFVIKISLLVAIGLFGYYLPGIMKFWDNNIVEYMTRINASVRLLLIVLSGSVLLYAVFYYAFFKYRK